MVSVAWEKPNMGCEIAARQWLLEEPCGYGIPELLAAYLSYWPPGTGIQILAAVPCSGYSRTAAFGMMFQLIHPGLIHPGL